MEECENLDFELTKLTEFQGEASDVISQDDEDEVEELQNSLREVVQDQSVKPRLQCLMVDPSFSMVTVQSEDSGIVWETASSRCSTPWASETSSITEACNTEGSGAAGKITIIFDEDKVLRRRTRSGRSSRLRNRLTRPGSLRSASALGEERPEMAEVSLPNVKEPQTGTETDLEEIKNKDQQLFSLISEGYEILNIKVPSKLPTVDEEESTELKDNLTYLDETPKIRTRTHLNETTQNNPPSQQVQILESVEPSNEDTQSLVDTELKHSPILQDDSKDIDYFEKFTLVDEVAPGQKTPELKEQGEEPMMECTVESKVDKYKPSEPEDSFVMVTEVEIVGEHLDEVFYGEGAPSKVLQQKMEEEVKGSRVRRDSQRSTKESGSVLFGSEETTLTPIFISPGPPKIIDPILLEEPTAMSFMYSDLYEDAVGEKRKSDEEEYSEVGSVASEKSFKKCFSDSEEAEGYLEKFILKDDTPTVDIPLDVVEDQQDRRMMWSLSEFEMTGCLTRAVAEEEDYDKAEDPKQAVDHGLVKDSDISKSKEQGLEIEDKELHYCEDSQEPLVNRDLIHEDSQKKEDQQATYQIPERATNIPLDSKIVTVETTNEHVIDESQSKTQEKSQKEVVQKQKLEIPPNVIEVLQRDDTVGYEPAIAIDVDILEEIPAEKADIKWADSLVEEKYKKIELNPKEPALEVLTEYEPMVHAAVDVTEKTADVTQTNLQIDLQEISIPQKETQTDILTQNVALKECVCFAPDNELEVMTKIEEQKADWSKTTPEMNAHTYHTPSKDSKADTLKTERDNDLILLVPKGQALEMDINMSPSSERITKCDRVTLPDPNVEFEQTSTPDRHTMDTIQLPQLEEPIRKSEKSTKTPSPAPSVENAGTDELETMRDKNEDIFSPLMSFVPQEDLSMRQEENLQSHAADMDENREVVTEIDADLETVPYIESEGGKKEQEEIPEDIPDLTSDYEIITRLDSSELAELGGWGDVQEAEHVSVQVVEEEEKDDFKNEELIEADYDIIDAEEQIQAKLAEELQGLDWFCLTCQSLLSTDDCDSGNHDGHEVTAVYKAFEDVKEQLGDWISELQARTENIEDLVSELELAYHCVEHQCVESEAAMQEQNDEMMALVMQQYNDMSVEMEEEKKAKLEQLYDQIVAFQESIDSAKATLETTAREADAEARTLDDIDASLKAALESTMSLELGSQGLLVFEDYAKANSSNPQLAQRKGIPAPQKPTLEPQEAGSASSTSVTVYWSVNPGDVIDCFQVYCMEEPQGAVSGEYRVTVKESYCILEELEPDKSYKVWVMAVNYTGCSLPSERRVFTTAPSVPVIDTERCTVTWDSAELRWSPAKQDPGQSFILEYCRQYELEGDGLRSIAGIKSCEYGVLLQPNENYLFYIKAVNEAGVSEQSEAALISTKGTRFHLLKASAHPALELSEDQTIVSLSQDSYEHVSPTENQPPSILGELLPARGHHYWETTVSECPAYRLGVAQISAQRKCSLGENKLSWCLQCTPSPSGYQMTHGATQFNVFVVESPERVGILLDYQWGRLCFYNAQTGQSLGSFRHGITGPCHPVLALDVPGRLEVRLVPDLPEFARGC